MTNDTDTPAQAAPSTFIRKLTQEETDEYDKMREVCESSRKTNDEVQALVKQLQSKLTIEMVGARDAFWAMMALTVPECLTVAMIVNNEADGFPELHYAEPPGTSNDEVTAEQLIAKLKAALGG